MLELKTDSCALTNTNNIQIRICKYPIMQMRHLLIFPKPCQKYLLPVYSPISASFSSWPTNDISFRWYSNKQHFPSDYSLNYVVYRIQYQEHSYPIPTPSSQLLLYSKPLINDVPEVRIGLLIKHTPRRGEKLCTVLPRPKFGERIKMEIRKTRVKYDTATGYL